MNVGTYEAHWIIILMLLLLASAIGVVGSLRSKLLTHSGVEVHSMKLRTYRRCASIAMPAGVFVVW